MELKPTPPDPNAGLLLISSIPARAAELSEFLKGANKKEPRFPDWRVHQLSQFIKYVDFYSQDLISTYSSRRIDSLAQATRNLLELNVWIPFCELSDEKGKQFFQDGYRDLRDVMKALQDLYTNFNKKPQPRIQEIQEELKAKAASFNVLDFEADYIRVNNAAGTIGTQQAHASNYKIASKFAHPTALLLAVTDEAMGKMAESILEIGGRLADKCMSALEKHIRERYAPLQV